MKYIIGTEYIVIGRHDYGEVPWVIATTLTIQDAQVALKAAEEAAKKDGRTIVTKIETRTLFNTDIPPAPIKNIVKQEQEAGIK